MADVHGFVVRLTDLTVSGDRRKRRGRRGRCEHNKRCGRCDENHKSPLCQHIPSARTTPRDACAPAAIRSDVSAGHPDVQGTVKRMSGSELACLY